jgi:hypothetical protein
MLVIVADEHDADAVALVDRWRDHDAQLLSIADLLAPGWCHRVASPGALTAVVFGRVVPVETISGVLTLLPCIFAERLVGIIPEDRAYVAAETTAFLASWLSDLPCPVLNRPTPDWLTGPNWRPAQWVHAAARLGIPVRAVRHGTSGEAATATPTRHANTSVTVVSGHCFGETDPTLAVHARRLAASAGVAMLTVHFDGETADAHMVGADVRPDLASPTIANAILHHLSGSDGC